MKACPFFCKAGLIHFQQIGLAKIINPGCHFSYIRLTTAYSTGYMRSGLTNVPAQTLNSLILFLSIGGLHLLITFAKSWKESKQ
jgi:hypothetical protein